MEKSVSTTAAPEQNEKPSFLKRAIQVAVYPISAVAGFIMFKRDVHEHTYQSLKRGGAFKDLLKKSHILTESGELIAINPNEIQATEAGSRTGMNDVHFSTITLNDGKKLEGVLGLEAIREQNIGLGKAKKISLAESHLRAQATKTAYTNGVTQIMEDLGHGEGIKNVLSDYNKLGRWQRAESALKFATVTGIAAGVLVAITNSKLFNDYFSHQADEKTPTR